MNRIQELKKKLGTPDGVKKVWTAGGGTLLVFDFEVGNEKVYFEAKYDNQKWSFYVAARINKSIDFVNRSVLKGEINGINMSNCRKLPFNNGAFLVENLEDSEQAFEKIINLFQGSIKHMKAISENPINYVAIEKPTAVLHIVLNGKKIQVAEKDLDTEMNLEDAKKTCSKLGNGWRLPTKDELEAMYEQLHQKGLGNFIERYWSSTESKAYTVAWYQDFTNGKKLASSMSVTFRVRAVRAF